MNSDTQKPINEARMTLKRRYEWEIQALVSDVVNKIDMEIITDNDSTRSYVSNLLKSHPRVKSEARAAETLMCSENRHANACDLYSVHTWLEVVNEHTGGLSEDAYYAIGADIIFALKNVGLDFITEE